MPRRVVGKSIGMMKKLALRLPFETLNRVESKGKASVRRKPSQLVTRALLYAAMVAVGCDSSAQDDAQAASVDKDVGASVDSGAIVDVPDNRLLAIDSSVDSGHGGVQSHPTDAADVAVADSGVDADAYAGDGGLDISECSWRMIVPKIGTATLRALWGSASDNVYAVGDRGTLLHYDGIKWDKIPIDAQYDLNAIWGSDKNNIYAVGIIKERYEGIILHFDGQSWQPLLFEGPNGNPWTAVWGISDQEVFFAGAFGIYQFDGSTWKPTELVDPGKGWMDVFGCGSRDIFVLDDVPSIYQLEGSYWNILTTLTWRDPINNTTVDAVSASCASAGDIWLFSRSQGVWHYSDNNWSVLESEALETADNRLNGLFETADNTIYMFGENGVLLRFDGSKWNQLDTGTRSTIYAAWGMSGDELFLAGEQGTLLKITSNGAEDFNGNLDAPTVALLDLESDGFAAVSQRGDLVFGDDRQTRIVPYSGPKGFLAVTAVGTRPDDILLGGSDCSGHDYSLCAYEPASYFPIPPALVRYDGIQFASADPGSSWRDEQVLAQCHQIRELKQTQDEIYALCSNADVLRSQGGSWQPVDSDSRCAGTIASGLHLAAERAVKMWVYDADRVFVLAPFGVGTPLGPGPYWHVCYYDGVGWDVTSSIGYTNQEIKVVWGPSADPYTLVVEGQFLDSRNSYCDFGLYHYDNASWNLLACEEDIGSIPSSDKWSTSGLTRTFAIQNRDISRGLYFDGSQWTSYALGDSMTAWFTGDPERGFYAGTTEGAVYYQKCQ